jgi:hypothetical protein
MPLDSIDQKTVGKVFKVEINGQYLPIKSYSGGDPVSTSTDSSDQISSTIGHIATFSELTLVAYVTSDQKILADAMAQVVNEGKNARFQITVTEMAKDKSVVKTFVYDECLMTSLDFPRMDSHSSEVLLEVATFQPT